MRNNQQNSHKETKDFYNAVAEQSFNEWFNNPALLPTLKKFMADLPPKPLVLDLGCGTGGESKRLVDLGADVVGVDFSEGSLELAKANVPKAKFVLMDILNMEFEESSFDGVMEAGVLFHFTEDEQNQIVKNIYSILKPNGIFLSYYPEGSFEGVQNMEVSGKSFHRYSRQLKKEDWIKQVMQCGFRRFSEVDFNIGRFKCIEFYK